MQRDRVSHSGKTYSATVKLAPSESRVLSLICQGKANKEIAALLKCTVGTVNAYVTRLLSGLCLTNRVELCIWGIQHPEALQGEWAALEFHAPGCRCSGVFCRAMSPLAA